jgi:hypothetical protein
MLDNAISESPLSSAYILYKAHVYKQYAMVFQSSAIHLLLFWITVTFWSLVDENWYDSRVSLLDSQVCLSPWSFEVAAFQVAYPNSLMHLFFCSDYMSNLLRFCISLCFRQGA